MEKKVSKIDEILEKENYWCVDYFPERIEDWDKFKRIESYLLKPAPKRRYISKVINIVFKIVPYFDAILYIGDTYKRRCRRYEGIYEVNSMNPQKFPRISLKRGFGTRILFLHLTKVSGAILPPKRGKDIPAEYRERSLHPQRPLC